MHIPHQKVVKVITQMHRIAKKAVIHFELHGPSNVFDFHRYPRDYMQLYNKIGLDKNTVYKVFAKKSLQSSTTGSYKHALLVSSE